VRGPASEFRMPEGFFFCWVQGRQGTLTFSDRPMLSPSNRVTCDNQVREGRITSRPLFPLCNPVSSLADTRAERCPHSSFVPVPTPLNRRKTNGANDCPSFPQSASVRIRGSEPGHECHRLPCCSHSMFSDHSPELASTVFGPALQHRYRRLSVCWRYRVQGYILIPRLDGKYAVL
jgi:hypothetical protein